MDVFNLETIYSNEPDTAGRSGEEMWEPSAYPCPELG